MCDSPKEGASVLEGNSSAYSTKSMVIKSENEDESIEKVLIKQEKPKCSPRKVEKKCACTVEGCSATFSRPWRLEAHLATHFGEKPYCCKEPGCDRAYTTSSHLRRHHLTSHVPQAPTVGVKCSYPGCNLVLKTKQNEKKHYMRAHEPKAFPCTQCPLSFNKQSALLAHSYLHTGIPPLKCEICGMGFVHGRDLRRHERGHRSHLCPFSPCTEEFSSWGLLRKHMALHAPKPECGDCGQTFKQKSSLRRHVMTVHFGQLWPSYRPGSFACQLCTTVLTTKASLERHVKIKHSGKVVVKKEKKKDRAKRKDAGQERWSVARLLTGVKLPLSLEKKMVTSGESLHPEPALILLDKINSDGLDSVLEEGTSQTYRAEEGMLKGRRKRSKTLKKPGIKASSEHSEVTNPDLLQISLPQRLDSQLCRTLNLYSIDSKVDKARCHKGQITKKLGQLGALEKETPSKDNVVKEEGNNSPKGAGNVTSDDSYQELPLNVVLSSSESLPEREVHCKI